MTIRLEIIEASKATAVHNMFQLYLYDMSKFTKWGLAQNGKFEIDESIVDTYFQKPDHHPYFIMYDDEIAGFALVRRFPQSKEINEIGQFFVLGKYAKQGIGKVAFNLCLKAHPGKWQVRVLPENRHAHKFWESVISDSTDNNYDLDIADYEGTARYFFKFTTEQSR